MKLLRVDVGAGVAHAEDLDSRYEGWAGRGLVAKVLHYEVPPTCSPLGPENKLVLANGLLAGLYVSGAGRLSVGGKSPLLEAPRKATLVAQPVMLSAALG